ncbi:Endoribonuclease YbeY [Halomicronema hongdechloris C2206]|uniref:Endoribonuclease YbeY n=1 Tax=Halomicronema hongdechloris C2206 TaxID=1641165 RepID=A0A1Z3HN00_9CYAN|nr:rRNA maturation RNase YbeY [Halomicronema hongdechloris]ASC71517.1 Endoribonuclease YbeY [Halomicronema hongdechloris C2206]
MVPQVEVWLQVAPCQVPQITTEDWQHWFQVWIGTLGITLSPIHQYELGLQLIDDAGIQRLNAAYRHQDTATDVLAFAALEAGLPPADLLRQEPLYLGDIIISLDTAACQARAQGHSLTQEVLWLASHGLLHLLGWDHPNDERLIKMLEQQEKLLVRIGWSG